MLDESDTKLPKKSRPCDRSWYAVPCGLLLRRLSEVEACAVSGGRRVEEDVYGWIRTVALEMACQVDDPTDAFTRLVMDGTDDLLARRSHGGAPEGNQNARGHGAPRGNKNARRRRSEDD